MKLPLSPIALALSMVGAGCGAQSNSSTGSNTADEQGQQVGDVMASVDETGGSGGSIGFLDGEHKAFLRWSPKEDWRSFASLFTSLPPSQLASRLCETFENLLVPNAYAIGCASVLTFGSCSSNQLIRTFNSCVIGTSTLSGTVTLNWGGTSSNCQMNAIGDSMTRDPSFTLLGRHNGATLKVFKSGSVGQKLIWAGGSGSSKVFAFTNDGIRRVFTTVIGAPLFDFTTQTTSAITITGTSRKDRVMSGGNLRVTNNMTGVTCDYVPTNVTWTSECNCASSGTWSGTCSDGKSTTIKLTGCGAGTLTLGPSSQDLTFDRCYHI